jgi:hypothetical protein
LQNIEIVNNRCEEALSFDIVLKRKYALDQEVRLLSRSFFADEICQIRI